MKILIVMTIAEQKGGAELALQHLIQYGRNVSVEWITVFFEDGPMVSQFQAFGIKTYVVPSGRLREPHRLIATVAQIATIARQNNADLIFSWMTKAQIYGGLAAVFAQTPSLWYQWGMPSHNSLLDRVATLMPTVGILACSQITAQAQKQLHPLRPVQVVYPSAELEKFDLKLLPTPDKIRHQLGLPHKGALIGIVGRLQHWKGMHTLVEAMPQILQRYPDTHCVLIGGKHDLEPEYGEFLERQIKAFGLERTVIMTGFQSNIPEWMQAIDIFVHASDNEPFGIVIIEAMALAKPTIAGNQGGPTEIITDGINGLLSPYGDANALAQAILRYLDNPEFAQRLSQAAYTRAMDFSTQQYVQNFTDAVQKLSLASV